MTSKTLSEITKETWEKMAKDYMRYRNTGDSFNELIETPGMQKLIGDVSDLTILDAGTGHGTYTIWAKKNGAKRVVGIDISEKMIGFAKDEAEKENVEVEFYQGDLSDLSQFEDQTFDLIMSSLVVCYFDNLVKYFSEFSRILKKGGKFNFSDVHPMRSAGETLTQDGKDYLLVKKYMPSQPHISPGHWKNEDSGKIMEFHHWHYTIEDFSKSLKQSGFLIEEIAEPPLSDRATEKQKQMFERFMRIPVFILIKAVKI